MSQHQNHKKSQHQGQTQGISKLKKDPMFQYKSKKAFFSLKSFINGMGIVDQIYSSYLQTATTHPKKKIVDSSELICKHMDVLIDFICNQINVFSSDIIAILSSSFDNGDVCFQFEEQALQSFNQEAARLQFGLGNLSVCDYEFKDLMWFVTMAQNFGVPLEDQNKPPSIYSRRKKREKSQESSFMSKEDPKMRSKSENRWKRDYHSQRGSVHQNQVLQGLRRFTQQILPNLDEKESQGGTSAILEGSEPSGSLGFAEQASPDFLGMKRINVFRKDQMRLEGAGKSNRKDFGENGHQMNHRGSRREEGYLVDQEQHHGVKGEQNYENGQQGPSGAGRSQRGGNGSQNQAQGNFQYQEQHSSHQNHQKSQHREGYQQSHHQYQQQHIEHSQHTQNHSTHFEQHQSFGESQYHNNNTQRLQMEDQSRKSQFRQQQNHNKNAIHHSQQPAPNPDQFSSPSRKKGNKRGSNSNSQHSDNVSRSNLKREFLLSKSQKNSQILSQQQEDCHDGMKYNRIYKGALEPISPTVSKNNLIFDDMTRTEVARMMHINLSSNVRTPTRKIKYENDSPETIIPQEIKGVLKPSSRNCGKGRGSGGHGKQARTSFERHEAACNFNIPKNQQYIQDHQNFRATSEMRESGVAETHRSQAMSYLEAYESKYGHGRSGKKVKNYLL